MAYTTFSLLGHIALFILCLILCAFVFVNIVLPRLCAWFLGIIPLCFIFPKTQQSAILKKYARGKIIDKADKQMIDYLSSLGLMHLGTHVSETSSQLIELLPTARTTGRGMLFLRYSLV